MMLDALGNVKLCDFGMSLLTHTGKDGSQYARWESDKDLPYEMYVARVRRSLHCLSHAPPHALRARQLLGSCSMLIRRLPVEYFKSKRLTDKTDVRIACVCIRMGQSPLVHECSSALMFSCVVALRRCGLRA